MDTKRETWSFQTGPTPHTFLVLLGPGRGLHTLALDFVLTRNCERCSLRIYSFISSNGTLEPPKEWCPLPDLVFLASGRLPSSVPSSLSRVSWYRDANNCSLAYPP